jgi:dolichol kinase
MEDHGLALAVVGLWLAGLWALGRGFALLTRGGRISVFMGRKIFHLLAGLAVLPLVLWVPLWYLAAIPVGVMLGGNAWGQVRRMAGAGPVRRGFYITVCAVIPWAGILLCWWRGWLAVVALAVLTMSFGDAAAALAGRWWSRRRGPPDSRKTLAGLGAGAAAALAAGLLGGWLLGIPWPALGPAAGAAAGTGAVAEYATPGPWDNAVVLMVNLLVFGLILL